MVRKPKPIEKNVLFIYGTGDEGISGKWSADREEFNEHAGFPKNKKEMKEVTEKSTYPNPKHPIDLHYEGVADAIRIAQQKGWAVVIDSKSTPFFQKLRKGAGKFSGIDTKSIIAAGRIEIFPKLRELGIKPKNIFHAGHWRNSCVSSAMVETHLHNEIKNPKIKKPIYLLIGTPTIPRQYEEKYYIRGDLNSMKKGVPNTLIEVNKLLGRYNKNMNILGVDLNLLRSAGKRGWNKKVREVNKISLQKRRR